MQHSPAPSRFRFGAGLFLRSRTGAQLPVAKHAGRAGSALASRSPGLRDRTEQQRDLPAPSRQVTLLLHALGYYVAGVVVVSVGVGVGTGLVCVGRGCGVRVPVGFGCVVGCPVPVGCGFGMCVGRGPGV